MFWHILKKGYLLSKPKIGCVSEVKMNEIHFVLLSACTIFVPVFELLSMKALIFFMK